MVDRVFTLLVTPVVIAVAAAGWWTVLRRSVRGEPVLPYERRLPAPWGLIDILFAMFAMLLFSLVAQGLLVASGRSPEVGDRGEPSIAILLAGSAANLAAMIAALGVLKLRTRALWSELGFDRRSIGGDVKLGLITFAMFAPIVFGLQLALVEWLKLRYDQPLIELMRKSPSIASVAVTIFAAVVAAPFAEEFFFRLLLQGWLERSATHRGPAAEVLFGSPSRWPANSRPMLPAPDNPSASPTAAAAPEVAESSDPAQLSAARLPLTAALVLSAALFALTHASQGWAPTIPLFVFALALGFLYQRTHRLLPCIVLHFALNAFTTVVLLSEVFQPQS